MNMTDQDTQDAEMAAHHADMLALEERATKALVAAKDISEDDKMAIAWLAGLTNPVYKELHK